MGQIDEYSIRLGELGSDVKTLISLHAIVNDKLGKVIDATAVINDRAAKAHERLDEILDPDDGILTVAARDGKDWRENKKRAVWIGGTLGLVCGMSGSVIGNVFTSIGKAISSLTGGAGS